MRAISSASVESLTSESLRDLRDMIVAARRQRTEVDRDLTEARQLYPTRSRTSSAGAQASSDGSTEAHRRPRGDVPVTAAEVDRLAGWSKQTVIKMDFEETEAARSAYATLVRTFSALACIRRGGT